MKVLVYRYGSIYEPDVIKTISSFGIIVEEEKSEVNDKSISGSTRIDKVSNRLLDNMEKGSPFLFVFSINFFPDISAICEKLGVVYVCWSVDSPVLELFSKEIKNSCNRIFLFDRKQYERIHQYNTTGTFYLPLASDVERMDQVISSINDADIKKYSSDICFVGSLYSEKNDYSKLTGLSKYSKGYLDGLMEAQLNIYGDNFIEENITDEIVNEVNPDADWENSAFVSDISKYIIAHKYVGYEMAVRERKRTLNALAKHFNVDLYTLSDTRELVNVTNKGQAKSLTEMPKIFNLSKINLNITMRPIQTGIPLRVFDILSSGGFCMTNFQTELLDMFEIGKDLEAYMSIDELIDKCDYYLKHDDIRKQIALNGYEKTKNIHNVKNRMMHIIKTISG